MTSIVPFTESATEEESQALMMLLFVEALGTGRMEFASVEEYNRFMVANMKILSNMESADDLVELSIGEDSVRLSLSERYQEEVQKYLDEHGPVEMDPR
jgi:hypothetical protein